MESTPRNIVLVDGMAILFRGFYALMSTPLTSLHGEPTGGTFAFTSALVRMLDRSPDLLVVAWDCAAPTFRHEQFDAYKANRAKFPEELVPQLARVKEIVKMFGVPSLELPGFEADDIIGTLAVKAAAQGDQVLCVTPDKDYFQLVSENVKIARPSKPTAPEEIVDIEGVKSRYGVSPKQVIDVLALVGDASDNVPGVKGIGEKTAIPLIQKFGSVEGLYEKLDEVEKAGVKKKLEEGREQAFQARELVTIHTDVPLPEEDSLDSLKMREPDYNTLVTTFTELGFKSLVSRYRGRAVSAPAEKGAAAVAGDDVPPPSASDYIELPESEATSFDFAPLSTIDDVEHDYKIVRTEEELRALVDKLSAVPLLSFDLETDGLDWQNACIIGVALSGEPHVGYYIPIAVEEGTTRSEDDGPLFADIEQRTRATEGLPLETVLEVLRPMLESETPPKCGQNAKFDMLLLLREGLHVRGVVCDTMIAGFILDSTLSPGMDALAERYLNYRPVPITDLIGPRGRGQLTMRDVDLDTVAEYAAEDADITLQLAHKLTAELEREGLTRVVEEFDYPLVDVLLAMESHGVAIDVPGLRDISTLLESEMKRLEGEIYELAGGPFTINSPKQLGEVLFEKLKLPAKRKTKTGYSTDQFVLEELALEHPLPEKILEYRQAAKLKSTYVDALPTMINPRTGRVHTTYNQTVASTGRLSSINPNLQNIPIRREIGREIRKAFIPGISDGVLLSADYSQIELRIMAYVCNDAELARAFREGDDIHTATAMSVFGVGREEITGDMRRRAKEVNFGILYGIGPFGLARRLKISQTEAKTLIATYFERYPGVREYIDRTLEMARSRGYVETLIGRRRWFRELNERSGAQRGADERAAINMPVQGCLPFETKVLTTDGYRPIGELYQEDTRSLQVWTGMHFAPFEVLNRGRWELAELTFENGQILRCDTRHQVLVVDDEGYQWKHYNDLVPGDRICQSLPQEIEFGSVDGLPAAEHRGVNNAQSFRIEEYGEEFFYWLGYYIGDGWIYHRPEEERWALCYSFGAARPEQQESIMVGVERCTRYFNSLGLRTRFRRQSPQKGELVIYSKYYVELLQSLGIDTSAGAKTKRVPDIVLRAPLSARKAFLRGVLDADGYGGGDGTSNPSIHRCQRELLADLQLLFRTVGVEGKLRGPYNYKEYTSYRLDLIGGMLGRSLGFTERRFVHTPGREAPKFLVTTFLDVAASSQLKEPSHRVMYSRLKKGGSVSIHTLRDMVDAADVDFPLPLYTWSSLKEKRALGYEEETYTLSVHDPLHRFDSEGVISKNTAADIIKAAMITIHREMPKDFPDAAMILQVHDELVFEVPESQAESLAVWVKEKMENAFSLGDVPLLVETGIGKNWFEAH